MIHQISKLYSQILLHIRADTTVVHTPRIYVPYGFQFSSKIYVTQMDLSNSFDSIFAHSTTKKKDHIQELFHYFTLINHHDMSGEILEWQQRSTASAFVSFFLSVRVTIFFVPTLLEKRKKNMHESHY